MLIFGVVDIASVKAEGFCCYHAGQLWIESGSARQARQVERPGIQSGLSQSVINVVNPWRATNKTQVWQRRQAHPYVGSPPLNYPGYSSSFYAAEPVPLGLYGPVDPYVLGWDTGWPASPMPWGW